VGTLETRRPRRDLELVAAALAVTIGALTARNPGLVVGVVAVMALAAGSRQQSRARSGLALWLVAAALAGAWRAASVWEGTSPVRPRSADGWATLMTDPAPLGGGVTAIVELDGIRLEVQAHGSPARRLRPHLAGERFEVSGRFAPASPRREFRLLTRHVLGVLVVDRIGAWDTGAPAARAANRVRGALERGVAGMPDLERSLFLGLVIGDDRAQPPDLIEDFRASGLSHLTAVSGQNVAFVLVAFGPLLRRLRPAPRWLVTLGVIGWFALLTRFEPSVIRASVMAALGATAFWTGRQASPLRLLAITVIVVELLDPLLVWSVSWWLSSGATAGIALLARPIADRLPGPEPLREAMSVTAAAQLGVLPASLLVFGRAPLVALPANLLAAPVAGFVMVWGLPAGLAAALCPPAADALRVPSLLGTRWVLLVARLAARLEPGGHGSWRAVAQVVVLGALLAVVECRRRRGVLCAQPVAGAATGVGSKGAAMTAET
jgi:competence protein ComEC